MQYFVNKQSIVREIWGKSDTILFIFAGASAEFALNKAVDWLYFTGKLPKDPLGRLFSTVNYARQIVFFEMEAANAAIDKIAAIHTAVENSRGGKIPDWAYRDVLFMLIHYSISSFEVLERNLNLTEKEEVFNVFYRVGVRMRLKELPMSYTQWISAREAHLQQDLIKSDFTKDLFRQYKKHLGIYRYFLLVEGQKMVMPKRVAALLGFNKIQLLQPILWAYKLTKKVKIDGLLKSAILPKAYKDEIKAMDVV